MFIPTVGFPAAYAIVFMVVTAILIPVKEPGPIETAYMSMSWALRLSPHISSLTIGKSLSEWFLLLFTEYSPKSFSSSIIATDAAIMEVSVAKILITQISFVHTQWVLTRGYCIYMFNGYSPLVWLIT